LNKEEKCWDPMKQSSLHSNQWCQNGGRKDEKDKPCNSIIPVIKKDCKKYMVGSVLVAMR